MLYKSWGVTARAYGMYRVTHKIGTAIYVVINFIKYLPIFEIILLPKSGENV